MTILAELGSSIHSFLGYVIPFVFVLSIVVFFHELGHFWVARRCGVRVETFSIGFGQELVGWFDRRGTRWKIGWLPLGGYVKFFGDENAASANVSERPTGLTARERAETFQGKSVWQRMAIIAAGPVANFLLSIAIFAVLFSTVGEAIAPARVDKVVPGSPAAVAGFQKGDRILSIDGQPIKGFTEVQEIVADSAGKTLNVTVERQGRIVRLTPRPEASNIADPFGGKHRAGLLGIGREANPDEVRFVRHGPVESIWLGTQQTYQIVARSLSYMGRVISGSENADQLGGPLRIAQMSGKVAQAGFVALINLAAVLSASIGMINLFPVPMLDGGHLLYSGIEAVRGKPLGERAQEYGYRIGFTMVVALMLFATWNDLVHLRVLRFLTGLFS